MSQQRTLDQVITDILEQEGYTSSEDFVRDMALWLALARKEQYQAERQFFEGKYGVTTDEFEQLPHSKRAEQFSEEDIKGWEFAAPSLRWWEEKLERLEKLEKYVDEREQVKPPFEPRFGEILSAVARELRALP